ncbi:MAG: helix-turn-helix domain-containing protein [Rhodospirillaceae bacterium]|jgi:IclR family pca regulon transcriptional regulator|nr:helix-turn-helix domain-containing protein [Rhodospirillaceae bacterium]MBT3885271.1 helix-turn-helix domain-containing protein [Rhodospirillaceae bacterium]MBT4114853.1 helix-turn-helix domain-containing protein [Rhodospirillaceae bacterium]MBT4673930.1 helix-turn-helix domain-containing protein [Rhodospirillaceae bacterium]MBT4720321.1 helix-turn-helix domain-containing protein [Rhodospirillaceae bacterium]
MTDDIKDHVGSLEKGLAVIAAFDGATPRLNVAQAARKTGLTRASARRYLLTLARLGYAESNGRQFQLTPRVLRLGYAYLSSTPLPKIAQPIVDQIGERTGEVASLAALENDEVVFLGHSTTRRLVSASTSVGLRFSAHCTALGRVILAAQSEADVARFLADLQPEKLTPHTRTSVTDIHAAIIQAGRDGFSVSDQELEIGLRSIAVPVSDSHGRVKLGLAVSLQAGRMSVADMIANILPVLRAGRAELETML